MILADTSIWIDHLRFGDKDLQRLLNQRQVLMHPFIVAELALGFLRDRSKNIGLLDLLPQSQVAHISEVRHLIETRRLYTVGIGLIEAHLIASVFVHPGAVLWTRDKPLRKAAETLGIHAALP